jgi:hypothetical protein
MTESGSPYDSIRCGGAALAGLFILVATITTCAPGYAAEPSPLKVEATRGLLGLHHSALSRFLAAHMAEVGLADWRVVPVAGDASAPDRVEWTIKLNPYAGGEVRNFVHTLFYEQRLGVHRPVTIEARLYLNGQYQTLVEKQVVIQGGPDDPDLVKAVASVTENLLGPSGAYRSVDIGRRPALQAR